MYKTKSGPYNLDRIDIHCEIQAVPFAELSKMQPGEPSSAIRERVIAARKRHPDCLTPLPHRSKWEKVASTAKAR